MKQDIFKVVRDLLDNRDAVMAGNAVDVSGALYADSVASLKALDMLEPSLLELVSICVAGGVEAKALDEVIELLGWEG